MSSYSVNVANSDLLGVTHGLTINQIPNLFGLHNRAARMLLNDIDPIETIKKSLSTTPFYNGVWDYSCPADLKGNRIVDISPQYQRSGFQTVTQTFNQPFDISKNFISNPSDVTVQWNNGVKTLRINDNSLPKGVVLDSCEAVNTWATAGTASMLTENNTNFASGSGSLCFNVTTGTGSISETLAATIDMTTQLNQASWFYYLYLPLGTSLTSTEIRIGSSSSNYYSRVLTQTNEGNAFATGWNLIRGDWFGATVVGSPVISAINYVYIGVTVSSNLTGVCVDNIVSNMGLYRTIEYYSKYLYRDANTGVFQETVTDNSNLLNLDTDSYNLYFNALAYYAAQQMQGLDALFYDANFFKGEYEAGKAKYAARQPSQVQKSRQAYYNPNKGGYGKYIGRHFTL
jgi:hypothetical protein